MPIYQQLGNIPPKRHIAHRSESGELYHEELMGCRGFTGASSNLYHIRPPTSVLRIEPMGPMRYDAEKEPVVRHRHFTTSKVAEAVSPTLGRTPLLFNRDVAISVVRPSANDSHFYRNGMGDEYVFVAEGSGVLESQFGELPFVAGDQVVIHRGILHRWRFDEFPPRLLVVESSDYLRWPKKYRSEQGQLLEGAPFSERDIKRPARLDLHDETGEFEIVVKQHNGLMRVVLDHHPFDVVGWDGYYYPWAFNIHDFEPIVGRIHQPPPVHQFLEADGFVMCNFCPRPYDFHPDAVPAPYNHSNVGTDEVLFYASSEFMSRKGIEYGSVTLHPDGLPHGPHPGRYEGSIGKKATDELAVMVDTFRSLRVSTSALEIEDESYLTSWLA